MRPESRFSHLQYQATQTVIEQAEMLSEGWALWTSNISTPYTYVCRSRLPPHTE